MLYNVPKKIKSGNEFNNKFKSSVLLYRKYRKEWEYVIGLIIQPQKRYEKKMRVVIHSYRKRLLDKGNLVHGCKPILDTLKKIGVIYDDSPKWIEDIYLQSISKKETTTIEITQQQKE